jgi:hypothetical protein
MNRRGFFGLLGAAAAAAIAVPELELLVPKRTIFLPPAGGWALRGNQLLTIAMISREALRVLTMTIEVADLQRNFDRSFVAYSDDGGKSFQPLPTKDRGSIRIIKPLRYASKDILV